tara:strand:+ start:1600 stop:2049 length:450 start_codon:yes stop_codon:yes gene_type:complete
MTKYINKLESWEGWSQYATYSAAQNSLRNLKVDKVAFAFIDQVVANHIKHKKPLSYNIEGDWGKIPADLHEFLIDEVQKADPSDKNNLIAKFEYYYHDKNGYEGEEMSIAMYDLTKCKDQIGKEFLANGYTVMFEIYIESYGPQQYILG